MPTLPHVTDWILDGAKRIVRKLDRRGRVVTARGLQRLGGKTLYLQVPEKFAVYGVIAENCGRAPILFTAPEGEQTGKAYATILSAKDVEFAHETSETNPADLFELTWAHYIYSKRIFHHLVGDRNTIPTCGMSFNHPRRNGSKPEETHPFAEYATA